MPQSSRYRRWCFTVNHPVLCYDYFSRLCDGPKRFVFGYEVAPTTGTHHLQGYLEYTNPVGFGRVQQLLSAHWESARGTSKQCYDYCVKEGAFQSYGDWSNLRGGADGRCVSSNSVSVRDLVSGLVYDQDENLLLSWSYVRNKRAIDELVYRFSQKKLRHERYHRFVHAFLKPWQQECILHLQEQSTRKICWFYDETGGTGKSFLCNILFSCYNYDLFDGITNSRDITLMLSDHFNGVCIDVTRTDEKHFSYSTLEKLKNGFIMTGKYQGYKRMFSVKPVIVVANFAPLTSSLSADRWCVHCLDGLEEEATQPLPPSPYAPPTLEEEGRETPP